MHYRNYRLHINFKDINMSIRTQWYAEGDRHLIRYNPSDPLQL